VSEVVRDSWRRFIAGESRDCSDQPPIQNKKKSQETSAAFLSHPDIQGSNRTEMSDNEAKQALESELLSHLAKGKEVANTIDFANGLTSVQHPKKVKLLHDVIKSLKANKLVTATSKSEQVPVLTKEGERWAKEGSPEYQLFTALREPMDKKNLLQSLKSLGKSGNPGLSVCMKNKWVGLGEDKKTLSRIIQPDQVTDTVRDILLRVQDGRSVPQEDLKALKKRKMTSTKNVNWYQVKKGPEFALERKTLATDLTQEMLQSGSWKGAEFKAYSMTTEPKAAPVGALHPLLKVRTEFRQILLEMG